MSNLVSLPNENQVAPYLIKAIRRVPGKGLVLLNEFNKMLDFIEEADEAICRMYAVELRKVVDAGKRFEQPSWDALRDAVKLEKQTRPAGVTPNDIKK